MPRAFGVLPLAAFALLAVAHAQDAGSAPVAASHDYPTAERVIYVEACMRDHAGGHYEMLHKCSCALDVVMRTLTYDDYDTLSTVFNASTIGGERGSEFRDSPAMQDKVKQYRKLQGEAQKSCMIPPPPAK